MLEKQSSKFSSAKEALKQHCLCSVIDNTAAQDGDTSQSQLKVSGRKSGLFFLIFEKFVEK